MNTGTPTEGNGVLFALHHTDNESGKVLDVTFHMGREQTMGMFLDWFSKLPQYDKHVLLGKMKDQVLGAGGAVPRG